MGSVLELGIDEIDEIEALDVLLVSIFWLEVLDVPIVEWVLEVGGMVQVMVVYFVELLPDG